MKVIIALGAGAAIALDALAMMPTPALAQQSQAEVIVFGNDPCPRDSNGAIVVCRHRPETERYRLPRNQRTDGPRQVTQSWSNKAQDLMATGNTGTMSCSPVGPGGYTGCLVKEINQAKREAREASQQQTPPEQ
ncbi:hypothetical protein [Sphingomonas sp.]|uniref:hypothetical protein n=1 Tax=Sphingomonas sp. TaxID=28214 RepID=UPI0025F49AE7|nr:hypothetical protein [Sphingomonas sp.]MBV9528182.1 hypothetical protein [Sphingomonas sp.]